MKLLFDFSFSSPFPIQVMCIWEALGVVFGQSCPMLLRRVPEASVHLYLYK